MRRLALTLALLLAGAAARAAEPAPAAAASAAELPAGRYSVTIGGMLCAVCARAIAAEWSKLPEVESASLDYDSSGGTLTVRLGKTVRASALRKALRRAERVANLDARFELRDVRYLP